MWKIRRSQRWIRRSQWRQRLWKFLCITSMQSLSQALPKPLQFLRLNQHVPKLLQSLSQPLRPCCLCRGMFCLTFAAFALRAHYGGSLQQVESRRPRLPGQAGWLWPTWFPLHDITLCCKGVQFNQCDSLVVFNKYVVRVDTVVAVVEAVANLLSHLSQLISAHLISAQTTKSFQPSPLIHAQRWLGRGRVSLWPYADTSLEHARQRG